MTSSPAVVGGRLCRSSVRAHLGQIMIYLSTVDNLVPHLPSPEVVPDLPTAQTPPQKHALYHADYTAPTRQHELLIYHINRSYISYRSYRSYRSGSYLFALKYLDHGLSVDDLSVICPRYESNSYGGNPPTQWTRDQYANGQ